MNPQTSLLIERVKPVLACAPATLASTAGDGDWVSLKHYRHLTILIVIANSTTVTGTAVTLLQATDVSGSDSKALGFTKMYANVDTGAGDALTETAVVSNTFTTATTNSKNLMYVIEINADDLDHNNGYDCVRVDCANAASSTGAVVYLLSDARYPAEMPSAIVD